MNVLAVSALFTSAAFAQDVMSGVYGNTVTVTNAKGETTKLILSEDKSYQATLPDGNVHKGTWTVNAASTEICFTQSEPVPAPEQKPTCGAVLPGKKAGDTWEEGEGDAKRVIAIVPGV
jgi:hypothetical protein